MRSLYKRTWWININSDYSEESKECHIIAEASYKCGQAKSVVQCSKQLTRLSKSILVSSGNNIKLVKNHSCRKFQWRVCHISQNWKSEIYWVQNSKVVFPLIHSVQNCYSYLKCLLLNQEHFKFKQCSPFISRH